MQKEQVTYWDTLANLSSLSQAKVLNKLLDEAEAVVIGIGAGI